MATPLNFEKWHGVSTLHEEGLHGKGLSSSWLYGGVVHATRYFSSSWFSIERVLSS